MPTSWFPTFKIKIRVIEKHFPGSKNQNFCSLNGSRGLNFVLPWFLSHLQAYHDAASGFMRQNFWHCYRYVQKVRRCKTSRKSWAASRNPCSSSIGLWSMWRQRRHGHVATIVDILIRARNFLATLIHARSICTGAVKQSTQLLLRLPPCRRKLTTKSLAHRPRIGAVWKSRKKARHRKTDAKLRRRRKPTLKFLKLKNGVICM